MKPEDRLRLPTTVGEALRLCVDTVDDVTRSAIIMHATGQNRAWVLAHRDDALSGDQAAQIEAMLARAAQGEPLAYIIGWREFYKLRFDVTPDVLIPRPETEELVECVLTWAQQSRGAPLRLCDIGTGSGAIAVTLAVKLPAAHITAVDVSRRALNIAHRNARRHAVAARLSFIQSHLLAAVAGSFDAIIANPPYIARDTLKELDVSRWEPSIAFDGGPDGLDTIRELLRQAPTRLASGGAVFFEIGHDQGEQVSALATAAFPAARVSIERDLAGRDRILRIEHVS